MSLAAPDFRRMTDGEVWEQIQGSAVESDVHKHGILTLQLRYAERQARAAADQARASDEMARATRELATATGALKNATWGLLAVSAVTGLLLLVQLLKQLGVIE